MTRAILFLTTIIIFTINSICAQELSVVRQNLSIDDDEIIKVNTAAGQISLALEDEPFDSCRIKIYDNGLAGENLKFLTPDKTPLSVVMIIAMNPVKQWNLNKYEFYKQIELLKKVPGMNLAATYMVKESGDFKSGVSVPNSITVDDLPSAVTGATNLLQKSLNRKAILVITNEVEGLKSDVIAQTSADLGSTSAMVYLMSVNGIVKKNEMRVKARTNINGGAIIVKKDDYLGGMFRSFKRLASNLYTVSYELTDQEPGDHQVTVSVRRASDNLEVAKNYRTFKVAGDGGTVTAAKAVTAAPVVAADNLQTQPAQAENAQSPDPKADASQPAGEKSVVTAISYEEEAVSQVQMPLDKLLDLRPSKLTPEQRAQYYVELLSRPEMKGVKVVSEKDKLSKKVRANLSGVLKIYGREEYTKIVIYQSKHPFVGLYRESILLISTFSLAILTDEELRGAAAHELAHEMYGDELKAADKSNDRQAQHVVEHKCDLVAALVLRLLQDDPYEIISVAEKFENYYEANMKGVDIGADRAPASYKRRNCIRIFLKSLDASQLTARNR